MTDGQLWFFTIAGLLVLSALASALFGRLLRRQGPASVITINGPSDWFPVGSRLYLPDGTYRVLDHPSQRELLIAPVGGRR